MVPGIMKRRTAPVSVGFELVRVKVLRDEITKSRQTDHARLIVTSLFDRLPELRAVRD